MTQVAVRSFEEIPEIQQPEDYEARTAAFLAECYAKHGPIFRAHGRFNPEINIVYMVGPEANRYVLSGNRPAFSHHTGWGWFFGVIELFGNGLLTMDGAEHARNRKMMNPAFTISYMDRYLPIMNRIIRERIATWADKEIDIYDEARKITFDIAAEALTGLKSGPEVDRFREIFVGMLMTGMMVETEAEYTAAISKLKAELYELLVPRIEQRRAQPTDDLLGILVQARDENGNGLSDEQIIAHTNILLVAGHETSTSLASWLFYLLSQNPDYTQRVLDEQASLLQGDGDPSLEALKRMPVLDNALSEAERLFPPVANGPRGVVKDFEFHGYHIPAGTYIMYSIAASHILPEVFAEPQKFDPDRFAPPREEDKKAPYSLVGFGGGPRICIGINFAQIEIKALVSQVLRRYTVETVPGQEIVQYYRVTGMPLYGLRMRFTSK